MNIKKSVEIFYPLSPMQQGMLFHTLYEEGAGMYVEQLIIPLHGMLQLDAFQQAWAQVVQRHAPLRTAFVWQGLKKPAQVVYRQVDIPWEMHDWRDASPEQQEQQLAAFLEADRQRGFAVDRPPLMRMALFRTAAETHQLVWSQHHMLLDGWSLALVLREVAAHYEAYAAGQEPRLPQPRPYRDYISWLQKQDLDQAEAFWRRTLAGFHTATPLGLDRPLGDGPHRHAEYELQLPPDIATKLQGLARQHGLTLNTVFQGAWALLLSRYSGEDDVLFGATVAGRPHDLPGVEGMVGLFINTLPVRVALLQASSLLAWLTELQAQQAELRQYEYTPLVQIQGWSEVPRGQPLFESLVVFENYPATPGGPGGSGQPPLLNLGGMRAVERTNYPLNLMAGAGAFRINYDCRRFDAATVARIATHLATLLTTIASEPQRAIADLSLLTADEARQLAQWNATAAPFPADRCVHDLVAEQAARTPATPAVVFDDQTLSYAELVAQANRLARHLRTCGVRPDSRVALCLERSLELPVALLAILTAGAAYVPLDPAYPAERLQFMLADAQVTALITSQPLHTQLFADQGLPDQIALVCLDTAAAAIGQQSGEPLAAAATPESLAYVIYTSGSTGRPKGVALEHRALANLIAWHLADGRLATPRRTLQFAPISFDVSFQEHVSTWASGGTLVQVREEVRRDGPALLALIREQAVARLFVPFVALAHLAETATASGVTTPELRELITAGEQLRITPAVRAWLAACQDCRLYNHYGPTESHVVTAHALEGAPEDWPELPPIGRPIANTSIHLLDAALRPVPIGVVGELCIGGVALARGYLNRPDLTAERFVPNPFAPSHTEMWVFQHEAHEAHEDQDSSPTQNHTAQGNQPPSQRHAAKTTSLTPQASSLWQSLKPQAPSLKPGHAAQPTSPKPQASSLRLYRTGDLARYEADGTIVFLGRRDHQIKVRGFRIEVGEIEAALERHPQVHAAAVVAPESAYGQRRLVAYVVARTEQPSSAELRSFLLAQLPEYMVPALYLPLETLPLTPSGKLDRRALPAPDAVASLHDSRPSAPRSQVEEMLAQIWAEVLQREGIGAQDSFFELGGHSLLATQLVSRIRELCGVELPLRALFEAPTLAGMAERIAQTRSHAPELAVPPIQPSASSEPPPLSFAQQRLWFFEQLQPGSAAYTIAAALRLQGTLDVAALEAALDAIVQRHAALRTSFATVAGQPIQVVHPHQPLTLRTSDLQGLPEDERASAAQRLAVEDAARTFDLARGPLFDASLLILDPHEHVLLLAMHHIISDGWSLGVLMRELAAHYAAALAGQTAALPPLAIQYTDYAIWQRDVLRGPLLTSQLDYWRGQLAGLAPLELPTDFARPPVELPDGATHEFLLPRALGESIQRLARREGATLFMTLLAAWQTLLARHSGQADIAVGTPIAGRTRGETEPLIGYFLNTLVLRSDLSKAANFRELVALVRDSCLAAYAHQDVPFEQIVDALQPERDLSRHPLFQVMFVLQNTAQAPLELPGLICSPLVVGRDTTRFDLTLTMAEGPDGLAGVIEYRTALFAPATIARLQQQFETLLAAIADQPEAPLGQLALLPPAERQQLLADWNTTTVALPASQCIHQQIAAQAASRPDDTAVVCGNRQLSYRELEQHANLLAHQLQQRGVGPDVRVGVYMERSLELPIALLAILKAGGAYVPLDPSYPAERIAFMLADSRAAVVLTQTHLRPELPQDHAHTLCLDAGWPHGVSGPHDAPLSPVTPHNLAYVIYTSGSTGTPKGVMITHHNVINFFVGMDQRIGDQPGTWLAVTSISFDISVLELFWTLARGFTVVIHADSSALSERQPRRSLVARPIAFSLFYFASDERSDTTDRYRLLIEGAKFADKHGFSAVWTPERHFHAFGGLYPNPAVTGAALATITERVHIRAGSVVAPLHNPVRLAEDWSVIDNLSHGRVGISFASGWHADDFIFAPEHFADRREVMVRQIDTVRRLWRGERVAFTGGAGNAVEVAIVPRPVQPELPFWVTVSGNPETFRLAGELGANLLTHLLGQSVESLAEKIALYRQAWREHGHGPTEGHVTLMLHTFVGRDAAAVRAKVAGPFRQYLSTSLDLIGNLMRSLGREPGDGPLADDDLAALLDHAFERYYETSSLMGTPASCLQKIDQFKRIGVDEVACLIDFGVDSESVLASLHELALLQQRSNPHTDDVDESVAALISRHQISHLQCTPSLARMLTLDAGALAALQSIRMLLLGGEALPLALWEQLRATLPAALHNMYGPTETTIWSTTHPLDADVAIGRPIANTQIYVVDQLLQPQPIGVPGDLYIGGDGLARGYLDRPDLTAERFIPNPFAAIPAEARVVQHEEHEEHEGRVDQAHQNTAALSNQPAPQRHAAETTSLQPLASSLRLYHTGDRARWRADGTLEFLGRTDAQIKLRGYRIEIGEIEAAISRQPEVREAVVLAHDGGGEQRLIAYVVLAQAQPDDLTEQLRTALAVQLPAYMLPSVVVPLEALPLTPNGKIDRRALPAPDGARPSLADGYVAPQTPIEQLIANVWADLLGLDRVGIHDNFFQLGGNSLLATLLVSRLREALAAELPVRSLFEAPTVHGLVAWIERSHSEQLGRTPPPLLAAARGTPLPLSFAQQRLWFLNQIQPDSWAYNEPTAIRLAGPLDHLAMERALNALVQRHEALRTTVALLDQEPVQIIHPYTPQPLALIDLTPLPAEQREQELRRLARADARQLFDLRQGPLFRTTLVRAAPDDHVLLLSMHHIICDGWSKSIIIGELTESYNHAARGEQLQLPELPLQYADYAVWQRQWLQSDAVAEQLDYWRQQLRAAPTLQLPTDYARPPMPSFQGAVHGFVVEPALSQALATLSRREGATLFMTLLAVWQLLLARYSDQDDIVVGTPIAGRNRRETESMIGFFINTLALRSDLGGNPSFKELLARVRTVCLAAYSHQDLPFEQVVEAVQPERNLSRQPLFQVIFSLQNTPRAALDLRDLQPQPVELDHAAAKFDLDLNLAETEAGLVGSLNYSTDLFTAATAARISGHYTALLAAVAAQPERPIQELSMLVEGERARVVAAWNDTATHYPHAAALPALFAAQVARTPEALAVVAGDSTLSYAELDQASSQLAQRLRACGVRAGDAVGVALERSRELIIAMLAVLKAGGYYAPLDPSYPVARLQFIIQDTRPQVVLTTSALRTALELAEPCLCLDEPAPPAAAEPLPVVQGGDMPAYVMYTSGSTGTPKGVIVPHRAVVRLVINTDYAQLTPADRVAHVSNTAFDAATFEVWGALLNGAALVIIPKETVLDLRAFATLLREAQISALFLTTALFNQIANSQPASFATLRHVLFGGEAVDPRSVARVLQAGPPERLLHVYGPTESTTFSTWQLVEAVTATAVTVPIGLPIRQTSAYVLDQALQPVPIGLVGELYIGGDGLALGYLNQPALTAERFVPNPFAAFPHEPWVFQHEEHEEHEGQNNYTGQDQSAPDNHAAQPTSLQPPASSLRLALDNHAAQPTSLKPQASSPWQSLRLYRTGDVVRRRADGAIEFVGRRDNQIKLRGFRIELGEIEAALLQHPAVAECLVLADRQPSGEQRLIAYLVLRDRVSSDTVRSFLARSLPAYMVPAAFVALAAFPLTPNGKIDRRALPAPDQATALLAPDQTSLLADPYVAPRDTIEFRLSRIWETLLQVAPIGVENNFFTLGGHSLLAMRLIEAIGQEFGRTLPLTAIFERPTIGALAIELRDQAAPPIWSPLVPIQPQGHHPPFFCVHPAGGTAFCYVPLARHLGSQQPFYGLQAWGFEQGQTPDDSIEAMAERYLAAIRQVQPQGPYHLGGWSIGGLIALELAQQLVRQGEQVALLAVLDGDLPPPELQTPDADVSRFLNDAAILMMLARFENLPMTPEEFAALSPAAQLEIALDTARRNGIIPPDSTPEQVQRISGVLRAGFAALLRYRPQVYPGQITFLRTEPPELPANERGDTVRFTEETRGWTQISGLPIAVHTMPGQHVTLMSEPYVRSVAATLQRCLEQSRSAPRTPLERQIAAIWADLLGRDWVGINDDFFALGGHSLLLSRLVMRMRDELQADLPLPLFYQNPTVAGVAALLEASRSATGPAAPLAAPDLRADATLDAAIRPALGPAALADAQLAEPRAVFLTGATGFLGAFLLHALLTQTHAEVYCLVRAADQASAAVRIQENLARYGLWEPSSADRIIPVLGDLAQPLLGIAPTTFAQLADTLDIVYHNGALVHFTYPYHIARGPNVVGTQEALRLAADGKPKSFQYVSTLGVFHPLDMLGHTTLDERVQPAHGDKLATGYTQSKWVAEQLVGQAAARGLSTTIYRLGQVSGQRHSGVCQTDDFFWQVLKAGTEVGCITPAIVPSPISLAPVDFVSSAIVQLSRQRRSTSQVFHLINPQATTIDVVVSHMRQHGYAIELVSPAQWRVAMLAVAEQQPTSTAARLLAFAWNTAAPDQPASAAAAGGQPQYDCPITRAHLRNSAVALPPPSDALLDIYIRYFTAVGFFAGAAPAPAPDDDTHVPIA